MSQQFNPLAQASQTVPSGGQASQTVSSGGQASQTVPFGDQGLPQLKLSKGQSILEFTSSQTFTLTIPQLRGRRPLLGLFALSELAGSFLPVLYGVALYSEDKRLVAVVGAGPVCMLSDPHEALPSSGGLGEEGGAETPPGLRPSPNLSPVVLDGGTLVAQSCTVQTLPVEFVVVALFSSQFQWKIRMPSYQAVVDSDLEELEQIDRRIERTSMDTDISTDSSESMGDPYPEGYRAVQRRMEDMGRYRLLNKKQEEFLFSLLQGTPRNSKESRFYATYQQLIQLVGQQLGFE
ncbi:hypothetical protein K474DRAFT_1701665, partial [Panus rudis PR-1116 ss-1]